MVEAKTCKRVDGVLTDVHLEAYPPSYVGRYMRTPEGRASELRQWVREFQDFLRDHRSQDLIGIDVVEDRDDICSSCRSVWETYTEDGVEYCASCGAVVEQP